MGLGHGSTRFVPLKYLETILNYYFVIPWYMCFLGGPKLYLNCFLYLELCDGGLSINYGQ